MQFCLLYSPFYFVFIQSRAIYLFHLSSTVSFGNFIGTAGVLNRAQLTLVGLVLKNVLIKLSKLNETKKIIATRKKKCVCAKMWALWAITLGSSPS